MKKIKFARHDKFEKQIKKLIPQCGSGSPDPDLNVCTSINQYSVIEFLFTEAQICERGQETPSSALGSGSQNT